MTGSRPRKAGLQALWHVGPILMLLAACGGGEAAPAAPELMEDAPNIGVPEYAQRRTRMLTTLGEGILVLHGRPAEKAMEQWGFVQDATFLYFSGLAEVPGAILALDASMGRANLFLPPRPESFGLPVEGLVPDPGAETAERLGLDSARPWSDFVPWVEGRLRDGVQVLYVDEARRAQATGVPPGMAPVAGEYTLWRSALGQAFPSARISSAKRAIMEQRAVKSEAEVRILERNARMTAASLLAVAHRLEPGVRQRETEGAMVEACLRSGGEGPSFWPWTMSGPNAHVPRLLSAFFRYDQADRVALEGELVRVDIGCAGGLYGADVGRTLPVTGRFTTAQAEGWDLLIAGYRAGLSAMADGIPIADVRAASMEAVRSMGQATGTANVRAAAEAILAGGEGTWHIHGVGIESGEDIPEVLRAGMVVAYEPGFSWDADAYYLEDMILVTEEGHRILSAGLPYTAEEIAGAMRR